MKLLKILTTVLFAPDALCMHAILILCLPFDWNVLISSIREKTAARCTCKSLQPHWLHGTVFIQWTEWEQRNQNVLTVPWDVDTARMNTGILLCSTVDLAVACRETTTKRRETKRDMFAAAGIRSCLKSSAHISEAKCAPCVRIVHVAASSRWSSLGWLQAVYWVTRSKITPPAI